MTDKRQVFVCYDEIKATYLAKILYSIRCDFSSNKKLRLEKKLAKYICKELFEETRDDNLNTLLKVIKKYKIGDDGRYFRDEFPEGYEGLIEYFKAHPKGEWINDR